MGRRVVDLKGKVFGNLRVVEQQGYLKGNAAWLCTCSCGNVKIAAAGGLVSGNVRSCGCLRLKHGATCRKNMHPLYSIWGNMNARCNGVRNTYYFNYGGRGITVCDEWKNSYEAFRDYMLALPNCPKDSQTSGVRLDREIDRINNNSNYEPGNMRWVTKRMQQNNTRRNRIVTIKNENMTFAEAVSRYGKVPYDTAYSRFFKMKWSLRDSLLRI